MSSRRAWIVWLTAVTVYVLSVFHRSSLGVAGLLAADRFGISSSQLATFTVLQLAVYAVMQVPVGALLDRYGSKVLLIAGLTTMTVAQVGFAFATTYTWGIVTRVLVGAGDAMVFVSVIRIVGLWFTPLRSPLVSQITGFAGQLGALAAAAPLQAMLHRWGWTDTFVLTAGLGGVLLVALFLLVEDAPPGTVATRDVRLRDLVTQVRQSWAEPGTRLSFWCHFGSQFGANVFVLLWGFPFLTAGQGLSARTASWLLSLMVLVVVVTSPIVAHLTVRDPWRRSTLTLTVLATSIGVWGMVLGWPGAAPLPILVVLVTVTALGFPTSMIAFDIARTFNPRHRMGSATGIVNTGGFTAALTATFLVGLALDLMAPGGPSTYDTSDFRVAMCALPALWLTGTVQILRWRRRARSQAAHREDLRHLVPGNHGRQPEHSP